MKGTKEIKRMNVSSFFNREAAGPAPLVNIQKINLQNIRVASPCPADWNTMAGDERIRRCSECNLNVYNLSAMTEHEVQRLVADSQGRLCGRFYRRADGTILTQDCPRGLRAVARRVARTATAVLTAVVSATLAFAGTKPKPQQTEQTQCTGSGVVLLVMDPQGAVIQNAEVTLTDKDGKRKQNGKTNSVGQLVLYGIHTGDYVLTVNSRGFRTFSQIVSVQQGKLLELSLKLGIAEVTQEVVVQAATVGVITISDPASKQPLAIPPNFSRGQYQPLR